MQVRSVTASAPRSHAGRTYRVIASALLASSAIGTAALAVTEPSAATFPLIVLAFAGLTVVGLVPSLRVAPPMAVVGVLVGFVLAAAIVEPPPDGADMWLYHQSGRTVVEYGDSPYVRTPNDYPDDPFAQRLVLFRDDRSPMGPAYLAFTSTVASVAGDSRTAVRLTYQLGAAAAVAACFVLLRRARAPSWAIALVVLNPILIVEVVAQGRSDAYLASGLLAGGLLARRRPYVAAVVLAVAAAIKLPLALAPGALALWVWRHRGFPTAVRTGLVATGTMAVAYAGAGGTVALQGVLDLRTLANGSSAWVLVRENGVASVLGDLDAVVGPPGILTTLASIAAVALAAVLFLPRLDDARASAVIAIPVLAYLLTSTFPTARYMMWVLPAFCVLPRVKEAWTAVALSAAIYSHTAYFAALHAANQSDTLDLTVSVGDRLYRVLHGMPPFVILIAIAVLVSTAIRELGSSAATDTPERAPGQTRGI